MGFPLRPQGAVLGFSSPKPCPESQRARNDAEKKVAGVPVQNLLLVLSVSWSIPPWTNRSVLPHFPLHVALKGDFPRSPQLWVVCISTRAARGAGGRRLGSGLW